MTKLILTRHGETVWNVEKRVQGHQDSPLSAQGLRQALLLAERLKGEKIDLLYSSDMPRALATAHILQEMLHLADPLTTPDLREMSFGELEGLVWQELRDRQSAFIKTWDTTPHLAEIPGGETFQQVTDRAWRFLQGTLNSHPDTTIAIVTHGLTLKLLITKMLGFGVHEWQETPWQHNTALNIIEYRDQQFIPLLLGDVSHLDPEDPPY
ncbi:MAG: histidine phosphatase family protein [Peptococcaceae bacterium]|nr:histidine phosphatase family protein [Peptococcaceae bacterium]